MTSNELVTATVAEQLSRRGMSRAELARRWGVTRSTVTDKMTGRREWHLADIDHLAGIFGMRPEWFLRAVTREYVLHRAAVTRQVEQLERVAA